MGPDEKGTSRIGAAQNRASHHIAREKHDRQASGIGNSEVVRARRGAQDCILSARLFDGTLFSLRGRLLQWRAVTRRMTEDLC